MRKTKDTLTYLVLLELGDEISNIDKFLDLAIKEKPLAFSNKNDILKYSQNVTQHLTYDELMEIKYYTGFSYGKINSLKRGVWDYDKLGMQTKEIKQEYEEAGKNLEKIISKVEPLPTNMVTYRGCDLKYFWRFGIHSLEELSELKGTYIYDNAFKYFNMGYASAASWILFLIIVAVTLILFATQDKWVYYSDGGN